MMSYEKTLQYLGYESMAESVEKLYVLFDQSFTHQPFILKEEFEDLCNRLEFDPIQKDILRNAYEQILQTNMANYGLSFLKYILIIGAHPSNWFVSKAPEISEPLISKEIYQLFTLLSLIPNRINDYEVLGIDLKHIQFNLNHLKNYIQNYYKKNGHLGIDNFGWCTYLASLGLIQIKSLNFMHHVFSDPYIIFEHKIDQSWIMLCEAHVNVRLDGQLNGVNQMNHLLFKTTYEETANAYIGYKVNPMGFIENNLVVLDKALYHPLVRKGDPVIDFHIPSKSLYTIEDIKQSFEEAKIFFQTYFKKYNYKAFWCVSWLYAPQLPYFIFKQSSNILKVAKQGYRAPATPGEQSLFEFVFHTKTPDLSNVTPKTSLEQNVINYVNSGGKINTGLFLYGLDDTQKFGDFPYLDKNDEQLFDALPKIIKGANL